jgi:hypothetical protein
MQEFETFAYLDVQKTGSSFVAYVLAECVKEKLVFLARHGRIGERYDPNKLYFITVRDPLDQYISLYSHGCGAGGGLFKRMTKRGHGDLYDSTWNGFRRWLKFVLKPEAAPVLEDEYGAEENAQIPALIGFQTFRYLELAMREPVETLRECKTREDVLAAYKEKGVVSHTIRHESFDTDFRDLLKGPLAHALTDVDAAVRMLHETRKLNTSDRVDAFREDLTVGRKIRNALKEREWFMSEVLGY